MNVLLSLLGGLKGLGGALSVLGRFGWLFSWMPALGAFFGPVGALAGALLGFIPRFIGWVFSDLADAFKSPEKFIVRAIFGLGCLGFGVWQGILWDAHKVDAAAAKVAAIHQQWKDADDANTKLADEAKAAGERAEAAERAKAAAVPAASPAPVPQRVRKGSPGSATKVKGTGLFGFSPVSWGSWSGKSH